MTSSAFPRSLDEIPQAPPIRLELGAIPGAPVDRPCPACCHWSLPLALQPVLIEGGYVPLRFEGWLVYHLHTQLHQRPVPVS